VTTLHYVKKASEGQQGDSRCVLAEERRAVLLVAVRLRQQAVQQGPAKQSQLTQSEFWSAVYSLQETEYPGFDELESEIDNIKSELDTIRSDNEDKFNNMPDSLQQSETGQMLEERARACEEAMQSLDDIDVKLDAEEPSEEDSKSKLIDFLNEHDTSFDEKADEKADALYERAREVYVKLKDERGEEIWGEVMDALGSISCD
jgi:hypothetical protein